MKKRFIVYGLIALSGLGINSNFDTIDSIDSFLESEQTKIINHAKIKLYEFNQLQKEYDLELRNQVVLEYGIKELKYYNESIFDYVDLLSDYENNLNKDIDKSFDLIPFFVSIKELFNLYNKPKFEYKDFDSRFTV